MISFFKSFGDLIHIIIINSGHLTGCGGADPHNSLTSAFSEHFPHKTEKFT